nr:chemotaxis protein CheB [uncultured Desulfobacter sp.]
MNENDSIEMQDSVPSDLLPIVCIGASAGGLDAFKKFFDHMPAQTGIAFVLIPHLDPDHKSLIVEIIGRHTKMPVQQIEERTTIKPDHIYIRSPNRNLAIEASELIPCELSRERGINLPIDFFFRSLAVSRNQCAIGIILSGTMQDGTMGIEEIKSNGGLVIAQDPKTVQYGDMPQSAIETGMVDLILPIKEMPNAILKFIADPYICKDQDAINQVLDAIKTYSSHDFRCYKRNALIRRTERRMGLCQIRKLSDYVVYLQNNPDEVDALLKDLLIGVTSFFRDKKVWEKVGNEILPALITQTDPQAPFRVWVAGCSTGEEAYTIAILLYDMFEKSNKRFNAQIFATDVDGEAIAKARKGIYPKTVAVDIPPIYLKKYFTLENDEYHVVKKVRESVVFAEQNLVGDAPFSNLNLISCRNLLIYIKSEIQKKIIDLFNFSLLANGYLILGNSETIGHQHDNFETVSKELRLYQNINQKSERANVPIINYSRRYQFRMSESKPDFHRENLSKILQNQLLKKFAPAAVLINKKFEILNLSGPTSQYLDLPQGDPVMEITSMVQMGLRLKLRGAIQKAARTNETVTVSNSHVKRNDCLYPVIITVCPIKETKLFEPLFMVTFQEISESGQDKDHQNELDLGDDTLVKQLETELFDTREDLQQSIEELETSNEEMKASNEEMMSMNEELQSSNEELETSKEELQSMNEELNTVNAELREKVNELTIANNDIANLMNSTELATIFLDLTTAIRRFTPTAKKLFNLIDSDIGRPIGDLAMRFNDEALKSQVAMVLDTLVPSTKEVKTDEGLWYIRRILPFRTEDNRVDGIILTFSDVTELKNSELAVRQKEAQIEEKNQLLAAVLSHTHMMAVYLNTNFDFIWVNDAYAKTCNYKSDFFPGKNHFDLYPNQENQAIFQKVVDTGKPFFVSAKPFEFPDQPERGITYWDWSLIPTTNGQKEITGLVFTLAEVTDLIKERQLFKAIVDRIPVMLTRYDSDTNMLFLNPEFEKVVGWRTEEVQDMDMMEKVYPDSEYREKAYEHMQKATTEWKEFTIRSKSGEMIDSEWSNIRLEDGTQIGIGINITERKKAETQQAKVQQQLVERNRFIETILESLPIGLGVNYVDSGEVTYLNEKFSEIYGWPKTDFPNIDNFFDKVFPNPKNRELLQEKIMSDIASKDLTRMVWEDLEITTKKGEKRIVSATNIPLFDQNLMISTVQDLTEKRKLETQLQQAQRMESIGNLAGGIAHEFNNVLSIIIGNNELIVEDLPEWSISRENCEEIRLAGLRARDIVKHLLTFSRQDNSTKKPINIVSTITESIKLIRSTTPTNIEIREKIDPDCRPILGDSTQINQILINLCSNAVDALPTAGGRIDIELCNADISKHEEIAIHTLAPGKYVKLIVRDNGSGMDAEISERIFDPYFTTKDIGKGSGIGLSVVHGIVENHGGAIVCDSTIDQGTVFTILMPAYDGRVEEVSIKTDMFSGNGEKILYVDDEPSIAKLGKRHLESLGYDAYMTTDPKEALEMIKAEPDRFNLVISDMAMPNMPGDQLIDEILSINPQMPTMICSGYSSRMSKEKASKMGINAFVMKPLNKAELAKKVREILE